MSSALGLPRSLLQLTALTSLSVGGPACDAAMADGVSKLRWLQRLQWDCGSALLTELRCLTVLSSLQELQLGGWAQQGCWSVARAENMEDPVALYNGYSCSDELVMRAVLKTEPFWVRWQDAGLIAGGRSSSVFLLVCMIRDLQPSLT